MKAQVKTGLKTAAAVFLVLSFLWEVTDSQTFRDCEHNRKAHQPYQALHEEAGVFVKSIARGRLGIACGFEAANDNTGAITGIAGVVVAIFTFTLWLSTHRLWKAGERQAATNRIMADAAVLAQRARVQITPTWETDGPSSQHRLGSIPPAPQFKFASRMDNVGQMPASNLRNRIDYVLIEGFLPDDFVFQDTAPHLSQAGVLGTKQFFLGPHIPRDRYITADEMEKMRREELRLYLYGWVTYSDGFNDTPRRITKFCYWVRVTGNPQMPTVFIPHERYNYAD